MRLAKLTGLEIDKLEAELAEVRATIAELQSILDSREKRMKILVDEVDELAATFGDDRRTEILTDQGEFSVEDLIAEEDMVITISHTGYIKRIPVTTYRRQRRGGRGLTGMETKEADWVEHLFIASTHDYLMFFSDRGTVYWLKVHEIPQGGRAARGKPVVNCINIREGERIAALVPVRKFGDDEWLMFVTRNGTVKKTVLSAYGNVRTVGINAINIDADDELIDVQKTRGNDDIVLATSFGMSIRFHETDVRRDGARHQRRQGHRARHRATRSSAWWSCANGPSCWSSASAASASAARSPTTACSSAAARASSPCSRPRRPAS